MRVTVRVPATSANLGPGFDCFGLALDLVNVVTVDTDADPGVTWEGEGAEELPTDGSDMVSRAIAATAAELEGRIPPLAVTGANAIPLMRGLGSSAAAAVAGAAIGHVLLDNFEHDQPFATFRTAARLEGHPDNAAAAAFGGVTYVVDGVVRTLQPHPELRPVVLVPDRLRVGTEQARSVLPTTVPFGGAVDTIAHVAALVEGLTSEPAMLRFALLHEQLHEDARLALIPEAKDLRDRLRSTGIPVCLSGSGPSILAFERDGHVVGELPDGWRALRPGIRSTGVEVEVEA